MPLEILAMFGILGGAFAVVYGARRYGPLLFKRLDRMIMRHLEEPPYLAPPSSYEDQPMLGYPLIMSGGERRARGSRSPLVGRERK